MVFTSCLFCMKCKDVVQLEVRPLSELAEEITVKTGYEIISHRLDFFGICPHCQDKQ